MSRKWHSQSKGLLCTSPLAQRFDPTTLYSMASPGTFGVSTVSVLQTLDRWHACTASSLHKSLLSVQSAMKGTGDSVLERFYGSDRNAQERCEGYPAKPSDTSKQLTFLSNHHPSNQTVPDQWLETRCSEFPTNSHRLSRKRAIETPAHTPLHTARRRSARVLKANPRRAQSTWFTDLRPWVTSLQETYTILNIKSYKYCNWRFRLNWNLCCTFCYASIHFGGNSSLFVALLCV